jgi:hypothetical protein
MQYSHPPFSCFGPTNHVWPARASAGTAAPALAPPLVDEALNSPGEPLERPTRTLMERRFGHDFSRVRIHTDARSAESAQAVGARAYTVGREVVFGPGQYAPGSLEGQRLIAHELTHTIQQSASPAAGHVKAPIAVASGFYTEN